MPAPIVPITESFANRVAFSMPKEEVGKKEGLLLAIEQMLGGVAPSRQSPVYFPIDPKTGIPTAKADPWGEKQGIVPLKPTQDMVEGAQLFINRAMAETNSQDPTALRAWLGDYMQKNQLLSK